MLTLAESAPVEPRPYASAFCARHGAGTVRTFGQTPSSKSTDVCESVPSAAMAKLVTFWLSWLPTRSSAAPADE